MAIPPKLVILDRDGVINHDSDAYIKTLEEWVPYPSSIDAIARLSCAGWQVAIATNQSGIARGLYDEATLALMHVQLNHLVEAAGGEIALIVHCPHGPGDNCDCRKPLPGLLKQIRTELKLDSLEEAWMVGDSLRDLQAGDAMGCRSVLVRTGKGAKTEATLPPELEANALVFDDLAAFCDYLLAQQ